MENKVEGTKQMLETIVGIVSIIITIISIIVTLVSIQQTCKEHRHQKSNRTDQS